MAKHRQLAAIMFTDIEGYSAIMQENEARALLMKKRHRTILHREHEHYNGRIIQYYGDGSLSIFKSVVDAVTCAFIMQRSFRQRPVVPVRIGLHSGDIVFDENDIFGDGVNIASRIETLGVPGSVLFSEKVREELSNHPEYETTSVGLYQFKNIKDKIEVFAVKHRELNVPEKNSLVGKLEPGENQNVENNYVQSLHPANSKSIAVLPFINLSNDPDQEYFSEGISEEILNSLSKIDDLRVASRSSSFQFSGKNINLTDVKEKLGVSTIMHGSIRKQDRRLRLMVQLTNVEDGFQLWSEKYDRDMDDVFAIQDEIALAITEKLKGTLLGNDKTLIKKNKTPNVEAYEFYLKGRFHMNKRGASILSAIHYYEQAIELDPEFALAYTGYADANLMAAFYALVPPSNVLKKVRNAAEKALHLNNTSAEAYCTMGCLFNCLEWNWKEADQNYLRSIELNPKYPQVHFWYGSFFLAWVKGDFLGAIAHGRLAIELEPFSPIALGMYSSLLYSIGEFQEAIIYAEKGIEAEPDSFICSLYKGLSLLALNKFEEGIKVLEQLSQISNRFHLAQNALVISYCMAWKFKKAEELMLQLKERARNEYIAYTLTAISLAYLEELDQAFDLFDKALAEHEPLLLSLKYQNWVPASLKEDSRYHELLKKIDYP